MNRSICVFCSSSNNVKTCFFEEAKELGEIIAGKGYTLVYGGAEVGLMGTLAKSVHANGGEVVGVIPSKLKDKEVAYVKADELVVTKDMRDRKTIMEERSDAFIALPGGFGTLEEIFEIMTLRMLKYHSKPIIIVNSNNFYDLLIKLLDYIISEQFAKPTSTQHYKIVANPEEAISYIENVLGW